MLYVFDLRKGSKRRHVGAGDAGGERSDKSGGLMAGLVHREGRRAISRRPVFLLRSRFMKPMTCGGKPSSDPCVASEKKTPPVEKRGFQSRPGLEGRHHSGLAQRAVRPSGSSGDRRRVFQPRLATPTKPRKPEMLMSASIHCMPRQCDRGRFVPGPLDTAPGSCILAESVVPAEGIEPPTFGLQNRCSTAELSRLRR